MKAKKIVLLLPFIILYGLSKNYAQISIGGEPFSFTNSITKTISTVEMAKIDIESLLWEDKNTPEDTPYRFGYGFDVSYNLNNSGTWIILEDGSKLWKLHIKTENAYSINLIYDMFWLPDSAKFLNLLKMSFLLGLFKL
jgi:hypothetical protein